MRIVDFKGEVIHPDNSVWIGEHEEMMSRFGGSRFVDARTFREHYPSKPLRRAYMRDTGQAHYFPHHTGGA